MSNKALLLYTNRQSSLFYVSLVESVSREEIRLFSLHQRAREIMHYSPVNNKKYYTANSNSPIKISYFCHVIG